MKTLEKRENKVKRNQQFDIEIIDAMVDELTRTQFAILSWSSCGKSLTDITEILKVDKDSLRDEVNEIIRVFEVSKISQAEILYVFWIEDFERTLKQRRGF